MKKNNTLRAKATALYKKLDEKFKGNLKNILLAVLIVILLAMSIYLIAAIYLNSKKPKIDNITNECIKAVGAAYGTMALGDYHITSFIVEDDPVYDFGMTNNRTGCYLNANYAGLPEMYLSDGKLYFRNNGDDTWYYTQPEDAEYYVSYMEELENEYMVNYLNYAEYSKINTTEKTYRGEACYDLQFYYDENQLYYNLNAEESNGITVQDNYEEEIGTEKETQYYEGHYYIRKKDMKLISFVSMIGETFLFNEESITLPDDIENAEKGEIHINYIDDEDSYEYGTNPDTETGDAEVLTIPDSEAL